MGIKERETPSMDQDLNPTTTCLALWLAITLPILATTFFN